MIHREQIKAYVVKDVDLQVYLDQYGNPADRWSPPRFFNHEGPAKNAAPRDRNVEVVKCLITLTELEVMDSRQKQ
jgi:hypothetical protein